MAARSRWWAGPRRGLATGGGAVATVASLRASPRTDHEFYFTSWQIAW